MICRNGTDCLDKKTFAWCEFWTRNTRKNGLRARTSRQFPAREIKLNDGNWVPTSGSSHQSASIARCTKAVACHWYGPHGFNVLLARILLLGSVAYLPAFYWLSLSSSVWKPPLWEAFCAFFAASFLIAAIWRLLYDFCYHLAGCGGSLHPWPPLRRRRYF